MHSTLEIRNGWLVLPDEIVKGTIEIESGVITKIIRGDSAVSTSGNTIHADGMYVFPGLIDIHSDAIEKEVQPRPNTLFPLDTAFYELEKKLAACGITTMYHSLSLGTGLSVRGEHLLIRLIERIHEHKKKPSMIRHRIHLRYEMLYQHLMSIAETFIHQGMIDYVSYMLHAPGVGQYKREGAFEAYVMKNQGVTREEVDQIVENVKRMMEKIDWARLRRLIQLAKSKQIAIASHDDDSVDKVRQSMENGVDVIEFPLNLETAEYAAQQQLHVCVGAPNIVRGGSHDNNLSAIDAVVAGHANIICSDYYPPSMLHAVFKIAEEGFDLPAAVKMATLHPAEAVGIADRYGSIEPGKAADLLLIEYSGGSPRLRQTIVGGTVVYRSDCFEPHLGR